MEKYTTIHGNKWKFDDIKESVDWASNQTWKRQKWVPWSALVSKGKISEYIGQQFNSEYTELVEDGWSHDHCMICWWSLRESDEPEHGEDFTTDGRSWICSECHEQFVAKNA